MYKMCFLGTFLLSLSVSAQKIDNIKPIEIEGFFTNPQLSPSGGHVLLSGEHLQGVYLLDLKNNSVVQVSDKAGSGYAYTWNSDGTSFYYRERPEGGYFSGSRVMNYNLQNGKADVAGDIDHRYLPSYRGKRNEGVVVYTDPASLKIEAVDLETSRRWRVTNDEGQFYNAILSHDGGKIAVHNGADIYIYDIEGSSEGKKIGSGLATAWTDDDRYLIGFLDESRDGHNVSNSELYLFDTETAETKQLTNTGEQWEMFPTLLHNQLIFADDQSGKIYSATLNF